MHQKLNYLHELTILWALGIAGLILIMQLFARTLVTDQNTGKVPRKFRLPIFEETMFFYSKIYFWYLKWMQNA